MTRPAILDAIDTFLIDFFPKGIRASIETRLMPDLLAELQPADTRLIQYRDVTIQRSTAQINPEALPVGAIGDAGWCVLKPAEQFRREERLQPRDPETGQYLPFPEGEA